jgi:hypothetical protein
MEVDLEDDCSVNCNNISNDADFICYAGKFSENVTEKNGSCGQCLRTWPTFVISGFRRDVDGICALLGYYAASSGNPLLTFRDNISVWNS